MKTDTQVTITRWPIAPVKDPVDDFFERLTGTPRDWEVMKDGRIRRLNGLTTDCPISAVTGDPKDFGFPIAAARGIGMDHKDARRVFEAADGLDTHYRARLLEACGIEERHDS